MKHELVVTAVEAGQRLDRFVASHLPNHSRSFFQKLIQESMITVNQRVVKSSFALSADDRVSVTLPEPAATHLQPEDIPLDILYEDTHLLVLNKSAGIVVHPGAGAKSGTLVNALLHHCRDLSGVGGKLRPGIVHRLDKNTSGLLVIAKNDAAHIALQRQFSEKTAHREYRALVWGHLQRKSGKIETYLNRSKSDRKKFAVADTGKNAITLYEVEEEHAFLSLVKIWLKTGRTHQIRAHFSHINHPVFGDPEYSGRKKQLNRVSTLSHKKMALYLLTMIERQALHACQLTLNHPISNEILTFSANFPDDFQNVLDYSRRIERAAK